MGKVAVVVAFLAFVSMVILAGLAAEPPLATAATPSGIAEASIPADLLRLFTEATGALCPEMSWTAVAAVAHQESDFDPTADNGEAFGLMQFEPPTFAGYVAALTQLDPSGGANPPSYWNPVDAIDAATLKLCADGGGSGNIVRALGTYNCGHWPPTSPTDCPGTEGYIAAVQATALSYTGTVTSDGIGLSTPTQASAVAAAETQLGVAYAWGGESPGVGFDCSGLTQWAFAQAGIALSRVAQDQYDAGPQMAPDAPLAAGDLVFFGWGASTISHVGMYVGNGEMIDAPHTGAVVRIEAFDPRTGSAWGDEIFVAATDPGGTTGSSSGTADAGGATGS